MTQPPLKKHKSEEDLRIEHLRSLHSVRERSHELYELGKKDQLPHFRVHVEQIDTIVDVIDKLIQKDYPKGSKSVPFHSRWRHFEPGNPNRVKNMCEKWKCDEKEKARRLIDLALVSVLLDAGAGPTWKFTEPNTKQVYRRSEGLGIASFHMFLNGAFSSNKAQPHQVDAEALINLPDNAIAKAFQVDPKTNPLVGCEGRTKLLKRLGKCLKENCSFFGSPDEKIMRPGHLVDYLFDHANDKNEISVHIIWRALMYGLQDIWPEGRTKIGNTNMGDVWTHSKLKETPKCGKYISFHKLTQWLAYSLMEPLKEAGLIIKDLKDMTGLPEYRNGGLLIDYGVLEPKSDKTLTEKLNPASEVIVEWRALTIAILDQVHEKLRKKLKLSAEEFPLVKMLEAGTWKAGRIIAKEKRSDGRPPINIESDGTVF